MKLLSPLYRRLLLWFCIANLVTLLVSVSITERLARRAHAAGPDWPALAQQANEAYIDGGRDKLNRWIDRTRRHEGVDATLFDGEINLSGRRAPVQRLLPLLLSGPDNMELRPRPGLLLAGQNVQGRDGVMRRLIAERPPRPPQPRLETLLTVQILLSVLAIGVVGWWLARSIARPVGAIGDAARRVAGGDLTARVPARWSSAQDEVGDLARDFDRMAARIEALVAQERSVLQDVSHELRSPLARLQLALDLAEHARSSEEGAAHFRRAEHEIERLDELIGEALALSRMETDLPGAEQEPLDLAELVRERVVEATLDAESRVIRIRTQVPANVELRGSRRLLARALDNLLSNAIKFSPADATVDVMLQISGDRAVVSVRDRGPGVPPSELAALFRPFYRGSNGDMAPGHGLGLAIVERVARAHGGRAEAENPADGGFCVRLSLPTAQA